MGKIRDSRSRSGVAWWRMSVTCCSRSTSLSTRHRFPEIWRVGQSPTIGGVSGFQSVENVRRPSSKWVAFAEGRGPSRGWRSIASVREATSHVNCTDAELRDS